MAEIVRLSPNQVRPMRRGAPSAHPLDDQPDAVHLGLVEDGELIGVVSALPAAPGRPSDGDHRAVYGPFGADGERLVEALVDAVGPGKVLWADSPRPGLVDRHGLWTRSTGPVETPACYGGPEIQVLEWVDAVRKRPSMYVGPISERATALCAWGPISLALAERGGGQVSRLSAWTDGEAVLVEHDGAPWPRDPGGRRRDNRDIHADVTMALSSVFVATCDVDGSRWERTYVRGRPTGPWLELGPADGRRVAMWYHPDVAVFGRHRLDVARLRQRLSDLAYLRPTLAVSMNGERFDGGQGLAALAERLAGAPATVSACVRHDPYDIEVAIAWGGTTTVTRGWADDERADGAHVDGLLDALADSSAPSCAALVAVRGPVVYVGQTRGIVGDDNLHEAVRRVTAEAIAARRARDTDG